MKADTLGTYALIAAIRGLVSSPNSAFSVRGLAKGAGISPASAGAALKYMLKKGIAARSVIGRTHQCRANLESALCRQWKQLFNLDALEDAGLAKRILKNEAGVVSILLYGSFARGTNSPKSDVDLLVIAQSPKRVEAPGMISGAEVNVLALTMAEWRQKARAEKVFYENVIYDSIAIHGEKPVIL